MLISYRIQLSNNENYNPPPAGSNSFIFKIDKECLTSAGVFSKESRLIKTLWSGKKYEAGTYTGQWDGTDDEGNLVSGDNYNIVVISNNMTYTWEGVIGNTSARFTGGTLYNNHSTIYNMAVAGNTAYFACGYTEQKSSQQKFDIKNPQERFPVLTNQTGQASYFVAADNKTVYWAGNDNEQKWFVFATSVADDSLVAFSNGTSVTAKFGRTYNAIDNLQGKEAAISGLAVQQRNKYLFVAHKQLNQLHVIDKDAGSLVQNISTQQPALLSIDRSDNLWMLYKSNTIEKFSVGANGTLSSLSIRLENISNVQAMTVSDDNTYLLLAVGGNSQQLMAFDNSTGKQLWTFGQQGGYQKSAEVRDDKFYFTGSTMKIKGQSFLCFISDGSFWVGDPGNYRVQQYNANRKLLDTIMYLPAFYSCAADANNPNRVFADYLEFEIDYTKPLSPNNQSWKLIRNWGSHIPVETDDKYLRFRCVTTLSNKRTYALFFGRNKQPQLVELGQDNQLRLTGIQLSQTTQLYPDGSLRSISSPHIGSPTTFLLQKLSGFDAAGNPRWEKEQTIAVSPENTDKEPLYKGDINILRAGEITSTGTLVSFDASKDNDGWHLGGIREGDNKWLWRTAFSTTRNYTGAFPSDGYFDIGNGVKNAGSVALVWDNHIFWGYHGEFWKGGQTNKWNHVYDNGLFVNQFGTTGPEAPKGTNPPGMAGNVLSASVVKAGNGNVYMYHNDDNVHGGIHRWLIEGFDTIHEQTIPVSVSIIDEGLLGIYFTGSDLNDMRIVSITRDGTINFPSLPLGSARWSGFLKTSLLEDYTVYVTTNGQIRLWINDALLIDKWANKTTGEFSASFTVKDKSLTSIRLEAANAGNITLSWSSTHRSKEIIKKQDLVPATNNYTLDKFNLLDGLSGNSVTVLEDNLYGWRRNPIEEDYTDRLSQWWSARTNFKTYGLQKEADLQIKFRQQNKEAVVTRDLSAGRSVNQWSLSGNFNFAGSQPNMNSNDGLFFDIIDKNKKIIARLYFTRQDSDILLYGNTEIIAQGDIKDKQQLLKANLSVVIKGVNNKIGFSIAGFKEINENPFDAGANWQEPDKIRIYFTAGSKSAVRTINLSNLVYLIK